VGLGLGMVPKFSPAKGAHAQWDEASGGRTEDEEEEGSRRAQPAATTLQAAPLEAAPSPHGRRHLGR